MMAQCRNKGVRFLCIVCITFLIFFSDGFAGGSASEFINSLYEDVMELNKANTSNLKKLQSTTALIEKNIDFNKVTRFVLGRNFKKLSPEEFRLFCEHHKKSTAVKYAKLMITKLKYYKVLKEEELSKGRYLVHTILEEENSGGMPVKLGYLVILENEEYKIIDIIVSGNVSMTMTDREEINAFLENNTVETLIANFTTD